MMSRWMILCLKSTRGVVPSVSGVVLRAKSLLSLLKLFKTANKAGSLGLKAFNLNHHTARSATKCAIWSAFTLQTVRLSQCVT